MCSSYHPYRFLPSAKTDRGLNQFLINTTTPHHTHKNPHPPTPTQPTEAPQNALQAVIFMAAKKKAVKKPTPRTPPKTLTPEMQLFADTYLSNGLNQVRAYMHHHPNATYTTANKEAKRWRAHPLVQAYIQERLAASSMSADEALRRLTEHAMGDMDDLLDERGQFDIDKARALGVTHLITEYTTDETETEGIAKRKVKTKLYNAQTALELILKAHGRLVEKRELSNPGGQPLTIVMANPDTKKGLDDL